jgi:hypothetical protein
MHETCLLSVVLRSDQQQIISIRHLAERPEIIQWRTLVLVAIDVVLILKALAYAVNVFWLMVYGPRVVARINSAMDQNRLKTLSALDLFVRRIENRGCEPIEEGRRPEEKPIAKLRLVRPARKPITKRSHPKTYAIVNIAAATPVLLMWTGFPVLFVFAKGAPVLAVVTTVALLCGVATASFLMAPIAHICMGSYDVHNAGLQPYARRYRKWAAREVEADRNSILLYFLAIFFVVSSTYALCYNILYTLQSEKFHASFMAFNMTNPDPNFLTWLYYSATTAATVGYGDIYPVNHWAQLVVIAQILSGPVLITWLLATVLTEQRRPPSTHKRGVR